MPLYTYEGEPERYYPTLALTPDPGGQYELPANPCDGRWTPPDPDPAPDAGQAPADAPAKTRKSTPKAGE